MNEETKQISRRRFLSHSGLAIVSLPFGLPAISKISKASKPDGNMLICVSSNCLSWLRFDDAAKLIRDVGFDGVEMSITPMGHIHPGQVEKELPKAVGIFAKHDATIKMINTNIVSVDDPNTIPILSTARDMKIPYYKMGHYKYGSHKNLYDQLEDLKPVLNDFARINEAYRIIGTYQNPLGGTIGSSIWDLWHLLNSIDSKWLGIQFDVSNAQFEGGNSWKTDLTLIKDFVHTVSIKNFKWVENDSQKWEKKDVPLSEGLVDFSTYFDFQKELNIECPICVHLNYPIFNNFNKTLTRLEKVRFAYHVLAKDFRALRNYLVQAGIIY